MNYYQFHIGDYRSATMHLSNEEDLAYRRLLDMYYDTEQPIPLDTQQVSRRLRLGSEVIEIVLNDFFVRTENGWEHKRCASEIAKMQEKSERSRKNGAKGGIRKALNIKKINPTETQQEPKANPELTQGLATQYPIPNTQYPKEEKEKIIKKEKVAKAETKRPPDVEETVWNDFLQMRKAKRAPVTETAIKGIEREAVKADLTLAQALEICCLRGWQGFKAEWLTARDLTSRRGIRDAGPPQQTFRERDLRREMEEWEKWTGRTNPELARMREQETAKVIDITPKPRMELIA